MIKHLFPVLTNTALCYLPNIACAQTYTPSNRTPQADNSIGTVVNLTGANNFNITGGLQRGQNLFHSFTDFSIPTGGAANFTNPAGNQSIITRVTGNLFSDLNGTLNTNGANFLLINPNGVVFGTDARLNVGKAFVTSTASGVDFVDAQGQNYNFGVNRAGDAPLISIAPNVAFTPARLIIGGSGSKGIENYGTLQTNNPGQYIGLIGGNITFNGGQINAPGGRVELGGLSSAGTVGLGVDGNMFGAQFPTNVTRGDVSMTDGSRVNVAGSGGGDIAVNANNLEILGSSILRGGIETSLGTPEAVAGDIKINTTRAIVLGSDGAIANNVRLNSQGKGGNITIKTSSLSLDGGLGTSRTAIENGTAGIGDAGNIEIVTGNLSVTNGAQLNARTYGKGDAGKIKITATGNVSFDGIEEGVLGGAYSEVVLGGEGKGGGIEIVTGNLSVTNGARLSASTQGKGDAGKIKITATGNISFDGIKDSYASGAYGNVFLGGEGKGGGIEIVTGNLSLTNGAQLTASTEGKGDAGKIKITATGNISFDGGRDDLPSSLVSQVGPGGEGKGGEIEIVTRNLSLTNGGQLNAVTFGKGDAGKIKITATDNISFDGINGRFESAAGSAVIKGGEGKGGGIEIATRNLSVTNGAQIDSSTLGTGDAGDIFINSNNITLNKGKIISNSTSFTGGNINLFTTGYLLLRNNSIIKTDSDSTGKNNGGNITISSPLIVALPGNNDITANANQGNGGQVKIDSQGLFGIQYRPIGTDFTNDITASSTFGQSGNVQINTPGIDPGKDTGELPAAPNDASRQISQTCGASQRDNKFYITGRGGLPPNASEPQESEALWQDARATKTKLVTTANQPAQLAPPAIGWVFERDGRVRLIAAQIAGGAAETRVVCPNQK
jgi:filamentous hemagglutinin family protein